MSYIGEQVNNVKQNSGLYTPSEILQLTKDGSWGGSLELIAEQTISGNVANFNFSETVLHSFVFDHFLPFGILWFGSNKGDIP